MPKFIIEREIPNAGGFSSAERQAIAGKSCRVLSKIGQAVQWVYSYVTDNKIFCVYLAPNEEAILEHAREGGFPANRIYEVKSMMDPTLAEG